MHSGDKLTGGVCKCMDCAKARHDRLVKAARIGPEADILAKQEQLEAKAEQIIKDVTQSRNEIRRDKAELLDSVRTRLIADELASSAN